MISQYYLILLWIGFTALIARGFLRKEYNSLIGGYEWKTKPLFAFIVFAPLIWIAATRGWIGDTYVYAQTFFQMPNSSNEIASYMSTISKDKGYFLFVVLLKQIIGQNLTAYFFVVAFIQGIILVRVFRKYSIDYVMSIFLFLVSTEYMSWMLNGIRQFTAIAIVFATTPLILKKKYILSVLLIIFASFFHQSALIMIPLMFIAKGKAWGWKTNVFILGIILSILFVGNFTTLLNDTLESTQYGGILDSSYLANDDGASPIRALVYTVPAIIAFIYRTQIGNARNPVIDFCVNMSIATAGIYWVSVFTSGILVARMTGYCSLYSYILLPWEVKNLFSAEYRKVVKIAVVVCYLLFYFVQVHFVYGI